MRNLKDLVNQMSLKERLAEITQLYGNDENDDNSTFMGIDYLFEADQMMIDNIGSILGVAGAKFLREAQTKHLEASVHKIPLLFMHDIIHGFKTTFPSPLAMSCTWQPELVKKSAQIAAKEASVSGIHLTFSPMCDLARDARWGRVVETNGEDVYLNTLFTKAYVEGYQGDDISSKFKIASCFKHFAAYGMAEAGRDYNTTEVSEYALREYHFPAYKAAVDAGAKMAMTSFNALNGVPSSGNKWLFQDVLRGEWGFQGSVISDCTAIVELIYHGFAADEAEAAQKAINAGVDIEMVSNTFYNTAERLLEDGKITEDQINQAVYRVLQLKEDLGLFENPFKDADEELEKEIVMCEEHRKTAREIAADSMVLLKNDGILPLNKDNREKQKITIIGPYADSRQTLDSWSVYGKEKDCVTLKEALLERMDQQYIQTLTITDKDEVLEKEAVELAKDSDVILLALGEDPLMSGESNSRMDISLPDYQKELVRDMCGLGIPVIVILYNGRPLELVEINKSANAILEAWFPGTEGNHAVCDILFGDRLPSARLTMSFPYAVGQCPIYYDRYSTGRPAKDEYNSDRFSSRYVDGPSVPLYPFGYGLTYTQFEYGDIIISDGQMNKGSTITASCVVKNIGAIEGTETVQLYLRDMVGSRVRPIRMLKGFERIRLMPGEEQRVTFEITEEMLRFHTLEQGFVAEVGVFRVYIGKDSFVQEYQEFELVN